MKVLVAVVFAGIACLTAPAAGQLYDDARRLEEAGNLDVAFDLYLRIDGAEGAALRVAARRPEAFLARLGDVPSEIPPWRVELLRGDLLLGLARREEALAAWRAAAAGLVGSGRYPVDGAGRHGQPTRPFLFGPGSHRDHWLTEHIHDVHAARNAAASRAAKDSARR